jgi:hypothetical protein
VTSADPSGAGLTPELRRDIERWFARRGVPQLIEGYSSERSMDSRAAPLILLWLFIGTITEWGTRPDWSTTWNVLGIAATLAWMVVAWAIVNRIRHRPFALRLSTFDGIDIATIGLLPALPSALIERDALETVAATLEALTVIGAIYIVIGFGLIEIGMWAFERLWLQLVHLVELVARTLPLLVILVVFLLFGAEIWQVAHAMSAGELVLVLLFLLLMASLFVVTAFHREFSRMGRELNREAILDSVAATPAAPLVAAASPGLDRPPRLSWLHRSNLTLLVVVPQLLQVVAVAMVVMAFLVVFAVLAIPGHVQAGWIGAVPRLVLEFSLADEPRTISAELLVVSAVLGGIVGLYFSGLAVSDPIYRSEQFDRDVDGVRELWAARAVYLDAIGREKGDGSWESTAGLTL